MRTASTTEGGTSKPSHGLGNEEGGCRNGRTKARSTAALICAFKIGPLRENRTTRSDEKKKSCDGFQRLLGATQTTVPTTMNHVSSHRTSLSSSVQPSSDTSLINSPTAVSVSHGWRYQHGVPSVGWSPCERSGNDVSGQLSPNDVASVPARDEALNRDVFTRSTSGSGRPSARDSLRASLYQGATTYASHAS